VWSNCQDFSNNRELGLSERGCWRGKPIHEARAIDAIFVDGEVCNRPVESFGGHGGVE
jgi:hypothetical protein